MKNTAGEMWKELEADRSTSPGLILRRCSVSVLPDIFLAITVPEGFRCLSVSVAEKIDVDVASFSKLRDIAVDLLPSGPNVGKRFIVFKLVNRSLEEIFAVLCDDLIASVARIRDDEKLVSILLSRFDQWRTLLESASSEGLSPEQQRGLYGEILFIKTSLSHGARSIATIDAWVGPDNNVRDFMMGGAALEVKTTSGNNHQLVRISNERQLDKTNLQHLFLFHVSLEILRNSGESLNQAVDSLMNLITSDPVVTNRFRTKLFSAGFFDHHRDLYAHIGYAVRDANLYEIRDDFPRIEERDLRPGVGDVKYSIIVSNCKEYSAEIDYALEKMTL